NLVEYALGTDPNLATPSPAVADLESVADSRYLRLTIAKSPTATGVTLAVEVTGTLTDPGSWSTSGTTTEINTATTLQVRDNTPVESSPQRFIRLKASLP
ncbi:MAG: hypothetical protein JWO82_3293, partial [Akkermansiaceae bacterium]|nr:hypothetical protein [Akkermansiaceae bacterium]